MAKKTNVPLKRRRRSELNVKLIAIIAAVLFVVTIGIVFAVIGSHKKENNPSVADKTNYKLFYIIDGDNNTFIFKEKSIMNYTVYLDSYTIEK